MGFCLPLRSVVYAFITAFIVDKVFKSESSFFTLNLNQSIFNHKVKFEQFIPPQ